jgi:hypothetical protein
MKNLKFFAILLLLAAITVLLALVVVRLSPKNQSLQYDQGEDVTEIQSPETYPDNNL